MRVARAFFLLFRFASLRFPLRPSARHLTRASRAVYDPLTLLAAIPVCLTRFFRPVGKYYGGVEHVVVGAPAQAESDVIRDSVALRRFLLDAYKHSFAVTADPTKT